MIFDDGTTELNELSLLYNSLLILCNRYGVDEELWNKVAPVFQEIYERGQMYGCSFDANPTIRIR